MHKLDNPVWYSLAEMHQQFGLAYGDNRFYHPDYCPFGGLADLDQSADAVDRYSALANEFFLVGEAPNLSDGFMINKELVCLQMVLSSALDYGINDAITELKTQKQQRELFHLVQKVQPGYFRKKTVELGRYFGIYKDNALVSAAGERMSMNNYTEISAVVTDPYHTRQGYAALLSKHVMDIIIKENKTPYLHVLASNTGAIKLYKKLGFNTRRKMSFWQIKRDEIAWKLFLEWSLAYEHLAAFVYPIVSIAPIVWVSKKFPPIKYVK